MPLGQQSQIKKVEGVPGFGTSRDGRMETPERRWRLWMRGLSDTATLWSVRHPLTDPLHLSLIRWPAVVPAS